MGRKLVRSEHRRPRDTADTASEKRANLAGRLAGSNGGTGIAVGTLCRRDRDVEEVHLQRWMLAKHLEERRKPAEDTRKASVARQRIGVAVHVMAGHPVY